MIVFLERALMRALFHASALTERVRFDRATYLMEALCMHWALRHDENIVWAIVTRDDDRQRAGRYKYGEDESYDDEPLLTVAKPAQPKRKGKIKPVQKRRA